MNNFSFGQVTNYFANKKLKLIIDNYFRLTLILRSVENFCIKKSSRLNIQIKISMLEIYSPRVSWINVGCKSVEY